MLTTYIRVLIPTRDLLDIHAIWNGNSQKRRNELSSQGNYLTLHWTHEFSPSNLIIFMHVWEFSEFSAVDVCNFELILFNDLADVWCVNTLLRVVVLRNHPEPSKPDTFNSSWIHFSSSYYKKCCTRLGESSLILINNSPTNSTHIFFHFSTWKSVTATLAQYKKWITNFQQPWAKQQKGAKDVYRYTIFINL